MFFLLNSRLVLARFLLNTAAHSASPWLLGSGGRKKSDRFVVIVIFQMLSSGSSLDVYAEKSKTDFRNIPLAHQVSV